MTEAWSPLFLYDQTPNTTPATSMPPMMTTGSTVLVPQESSVEVSWAAA